MTEGRLAVIRDGVDLPEEQARALWRAFSEHMERSRHDYDGFARDHGFHSVRAEHRRGRAILIVSSAASLPPPPPRQSRPTAPARTRSSGARDSMPSAAPSRRVSQPGKRR